MNILIILSLICFINSGAINNANDKRIVDNLIECFQKRVGITRSNVIVEVGNFLSLIINKKKKLESINFLQPLKNARERRLKDLLIQRMTRVFPSFTTTTLERCILHTGKCIRPWGLYMNNCSIISRVQPYLQLFASRYTVLIHIVDAERLSIQFCKSFFMFFSQVSNYPKLLLVIITKQKSTYKRLFASLFHPIRITNVEILEVWLRPNKSKAKTPLRSGPLNCYSMHHYNPFKNHYCKQVLREKSRNTSLINLNLKNLNGFKLKAIIDDRMIIKYETDVKGKYDIFDVGGVNSEIGQYFIRGLNASFIKRYSRSVGLNADDLIFRPKYMPCPYAWNYLPLKPNQFNLNVLYAPVISSTANSTDFDKFLKYLILCAFIIVTFKAMDWLIAAHRGLLSSVAILRLLLLTSAPKVSEILVFQCILGGFLL